MFPSLGADQALGRGADSGFARDRGSALSRFPLIA